MSAPLRLRCPADSPREADRHLAIDVRLPVALEAVAAVAAGLPRCPCGAALAIDTRPVEPPTSAQCLDAPDGPGRWWRDARDGIAPSISTVTEWRGGLMLAVPGAYIEIPAGSRWHRAEPPADTDSDGGDR